MIAALDEVLQVGLAFKAWPLSISPDRLSSTFRALIVERTSVLLARVAPDEPEKADG